MPKSWSGAKYICRRTFAVISIILFVCEPPSESIPTETFGHRDIGLQAESQALATGAGRRGVRGGASGPPLNRQASRRCAWWVRSPGTPGGFDQIVCARSDPPRTGLRAGSGRHRLEAAGTSVLQGCGWLSRLARRLTDKGKGVAQAERRPEKEIGATCRPNQLNLL